MAGVFLICMVRGASKSAHFFKHSQKLKNWFFFFMCWTHFCIKLCVPMIVLFRFSPSPIFQILLSEVFTLCYYSAVSLAGLQSLRQRCCPAGSCERSLKSPAEVVLFSVSFLLSLPPHAPPTPQPPLPIMLSLLAASSSPGQGDVGCVRVWLLSKAFWMCDRDGIIPVEMHCTVCGQSSGSAAELTHPLLLPRISLGCWPWKFRCIKNFNLIRRMTIHDSLTCEGAETSPTVHACPLMGAWVALQCGQTHIINEL